MNDASKIVTSVGGYKPRPVKLKPKSNLLNVLKTN